jgi:pilus assembly protein CpaD
MTGQAETEFARMDRPTAPLLDAKSNRRRQGGRAALLAAVGAILAGCTHVQSAKIDRHVIVGSVPEDYRTTHPIAIEEGVETLDVPVGLNTVRLTEGMRQKIGAFAQGYLKSGTAAIVIVAPAGSGNQIAARGVAGEIEAELLAHGISPAEIQRRNYRAAPTEATAPIRVAYSRIGAHTAACGPWPDQLNRNPDNRNYFAFGCATQQNLAAMIDNPTDLLYPRAMTPPDAARKSGVVGNYEGASGSPLPTPTQSDYSKEPGAAVAQGVGSGQ